MVNVTEWQRLSALLGAKEVTLVAVSKTKPVSDIEEMYALGQRDFGENYVQELVEKQAILPADIRWHFIGHLQSNKVKYLASFVHLIHGVDNLRLLTEINKQAIKNNRVIDVLLQAYIAQEESKFGMDDAELVAAAEYASVNLPNVRICGLMGMATNTNDLQQIIQEFGHLKSMLDKLASSSFAEKPEFGICSMGMSGDYELAIEQGSNMVRIGSLLFGHRG